MELKHKIGLGILGFTVTAAAAYYAYAHKDEIIQKVEDLKNALDNKKKEIGEAGAEKVSVIADALIMFLDKYSKADHSPETIKNLSEEIEKLKSEIADLTK